MMASICVGVKAFIAANGIKIIGLKIPTVKGVAIFLDIFNPTCEAIPKDFDICCTNKS